jgi:hypothetical protein
MKKLSIPFLFLIFSFSSYSAVTKTVTISAAGTLTTLLSSNEKSTITELHLKGDIDARDFKCLRDEMAVLAVLDIDSVSIKAYSGTGGTSTVSTDYYQNELPAYSFYNSTTNASKTTLTNIVLPNTVTTIQTYAFSGCAGLTTFIIPNSLNTIAAYAFRNCTALQTFVVTPNSTNYTVVDGVLFNKNQTTLVQCPPARTGSYTVPSTVAIIGDYAFYSCTLLTSITVPNLLTTIGNVAFGACMGLTTFTIPNSVSKIGIYAFFACNKLTTINIPNSIETLGSYSFLLCNALTAFTVEASNPSYSVVDGVLFNKDQTIIKIYPLGKQGVYKIPNSVTSIGSEAFYQNVSLSTIDIPKSVTSIDGFAFTGCKNLTEFTSDVSNPNFTTVDGVLFNKNQTTLISYPAGKSGDYLIPTSCTSIGVGAFSSATNLTAITIPATITSIGESAFFQCVKLTSIIIPSTVTSIGNSAFSGCTGLKSITANAVTPVSFSLSSQVFLNINKDSCTLYVPNGVTSSYKSANQWKSFVNIIGPASTGFSTNNLIALNIYPTLATESFLINGLENVATLSLINLNGKVVLSRLVQNGERIAIGNLPKGVYIARIYTAAGSVERKVVKQ